MGEYNAARGARFLLSVSVTLDVRSGDVRRIYSRGDDSPLAFHISSHRGEIHFLAVSLECGISGPSIPSNWSALEILALGATAALAYFGGVALRCLIGPI